MLQEKNNRERETYVKVARARAPGGEGERWTLEAVAPTLNLFDYSGDTRSIVLVREKVKCKNSRLLPKSISFKYLAGSESQKPWKRDCSVAVTSGRMDGAVLYCRRKEEGCRC